MPRRGARDGGGWTSRGVGVANLVRDGLAVDDHVEVHDEVSGAALAARALADHLHVRREHLAEAGCVGGRKRRGFRDRSARGVAGPEGGNAIGGRTRRLQHRVHEVVADAREPRRRRRHRSARPRASGVIAPWTTQQSFDARRRRRRRDDDFDELARLDEVLNELLRCHSRRRAARAFVGAGDDARVRAVLPSRGARLRSVEARVGPPAAWTRA